MAYPGGKCFSKEMFTIWADVTDKLLSITVRDYCVLQRQTAVTAYFSSEQLLLFAFV